jgi:hypothetical protein
MSETWPLTLPPCNATTTASNFDVDQKWHRQQVFCLLDLGHDVDHSHVARLQDGQSYEWMTHVQPTT